MDRSVGRWRKPAFVAASVLIHAAVLAWLGLTTYDLAVPVMPDTPPVIQIELEPRPLLKGETPRPPRQVEPDQTEAQPPTSSTIAPLSPIRPDDEERPAPPRPRLGVPASGSTQVPSGVTDDAWRVRPGSGSGQNLGGLRTSTVGCTHREQLTRAEQDICDQRRADIARAAPPVRGSGNPARDAQFAREGEAALAQYEARRRPLAGGTGNVGPADCVGSNFGTGCAGAHLDPSLQPYATGPIRGRRDGRVASDAPIVPGASSPRD